MHELSLIQEVIDILKAQAADNNIGSIKRVKLVVGELTMAMPDSLEFAFSCLAKGDPFADDVVLEIEERRGRACCRECRAEFDVTDPDGISRFICPACGSTNVEVVEGSELYIDYFEGD